MPAAYHSRRREERNSVGPSSRRFFFNDTATTEIYTLSLHDALPICRSNLPRSHRLARGGAPFLVRASRSEEHTSELQSPVHLVCRLLLEKKKAGARQALAGRGAPSQRNPEVVNDDLVIVQKDDLVLD